MTNIDFFKQQSKNFLKDYNTRVYDENEGFYEYHPRFFNDIEEILDKFNINEKDKFTLMNAQHIIARLSGFYKWNELIDASESLLELGKLLLTLRQSYEEQQGYFTNMVESMIVDDWKSYLEENNLQDCDDETKLNIFKKIFLQEDKDFKKTKNEKIALDFTDDAIAQDMLVKIIKEKNLSPEKAVLSSITQKICIRIIESDWRSIALSLWGHDNPDRTWEKLDDPIVKIKLSKDKERLVGLIMEKENVSFNVAILYYMLFTLELLGYHI